MDSAFIISSLSLYIGNSLGFALYYVMFVGLCWFAVINNPKKFVCTMLSDNLSGFVLFRVKPFQ